MDRFTNLTAGRRLHDEELDCLHEFRPERVITSHGATQVKLYCCQCKARTDSVAQSHFTRGEIDAMPIHHDNACAYCGGIGCAMCVATPCRRRGCGSFEEVHDHHIAFRVIFGDTIADEYGTVPLCRLCHIELHAAFDRRVVAA